MNYSVTDYSSKVVNNVTIPRTNLGAGKLVGRYVWAVDVRNTNRPMYYDRWADYMVDVNTGELFFLRPP